MLGDLCAVLRAVPAEPQPPWDQQDTPLFLWILDPQGTALSEWERPLRAGPAQTAMQMKDDVRLKMSLPCNQGLNGHKPLVGIQHIMPMYSPGTSSPQLSPLRA